MKAALSGGVDLPDHGETEPVTGALARFQGQKRRPTSSGPPSGDAHGDICETHSQTVAQSLLVWIPEIEL